MHSFRALLATRRIPVVAAPMFLVSGPELVIAAARAGLIGAFPALNARTPEILETWCRQIAAALEGPDANAWALNVIVHRSYERFAAELAVIERFKPRLVITALGSPARMLEPVHAYGGVVFADVASVAQARKALDAGVDGLILLAAGAGGHTGSYNPFSFVREVRRFWEGPLLLAGGIADGVGVGAAVALGADAVYMGTRFIASSESLVAADYKTMLTASGVDDIVASAAVTGVPASWLRKSLEAAGWTPERLKQEKKLDLSVESLNDTKAWKHLWSAGQGVGLIDRVESVQSIADALAAEYLRKS